MFISAPDEPPSRLQAVLEGFLDGILILTELGGWVHANAIARRICHQLSHDPAQPNAVPKEIWHVCWSLIDSRELYPEQKIVMESEVMTQTGAVLRIRARWLDAEIDEPPLQASAAIGNSPSKLAGQYPCLLVVLEDLGQTMQDLAASQARKYGLTQRQTQVWALRQSGCSYQDIADRLYITLNTVKKHIKDVRAKIQDAQAWEDCAGFRVRRQSVK